MSLDMCFSEQSKTHFILQEDFSSVYISSVPLNVCSMETMCCVLLGMAETKGNGCGQTIVLEGEEKRKTQRQRRRQEKMEK